MEIRYVKGHLAGRVSWYADADAQALIDAGTAEPYLGKGKPAPAAKPPSGKPAKGKR